MFRSVLGIHNVKSAVIPNVDMNDIPEDDRERAETCRRKLHYKNERRKAIL